MNGLPKVSKRERFWSFLKSVGKRITQRKLDKRTRPIIAIMVVVVLAMILLAFAIPKKQYDFGGLLFALGAFVVGASVGFLFGIPRTLQGDQPSQALRHKVNTNLEEISDWLTKIIVGLGLTQLIRVPDLVEDLAEYQASVFGSPDHAPLAATAIVLFGICGFLIGYLGTRLFLQEAIATSDRFLTPQEAKDLSQANIESAMWFGLYQTNGYREVLDIGERYKEIMSDRPYYWLRLAAAYGQLAKNEPQRKAEAKRRALAAANRAVALEPAVKDDLAQIWNPSHPRKEEGEDDLEVFYPDEEFKSLLAGE